jgi:hypothetical protein
MSLSRTLTISALNAALCALSATAQAAATANCQVYDGINSSVNGTTGCSASVNHTFADTVTHTVYLDPLLTVPQQDLFTINESKQAFISGSFGTYHAKTFVSGDLNYYHYTVVNAQGMVTAEATDLNPLTGDVTQGVAQVDWTDPLMFTAAGLTSVQVLVNVPLSASITSNCITGNGLALATVELNSGPAQTSLGGTASGVSVCSASQNFSASALVTVPVGTPVNLHGFFKISASLNNWLVDPGYSNYTDPNVGHALASVDASNTAHFYLDVVTAGAHYFRIDDPTALDAYATPVPVPAALPLMASGLAFLGAAWRRRSTRPGLIT